MINNKQNALPRKELPDSDPMARPLDKARRTWWQNKAEVTRNFANRRFDMSMAHQDMNNVIGFNLAVVQMQIQDFIKNGVKRK